jgi:hypothetical protein
LAGAEADADEALELALPLALGLALADSDPELGAAAEGSAELADSAPLLDAAAEGATEDPEVGEVPITQYLPLSLAQMASLRGRMRYRTS